jgi:DNA-binding MarR family transcriptional regulator
MTDVKAARRAQAQERGKAHVTGREPARLDRALDFMRLLWEVEHELERASKQMAARFGVTGPQRLVLRLVEQFPQITPGRLAGIVQWHPSTLTGILHRLERQGCLRRAADPADGRRALLRIGAGGRRFTRVGLGTVETAVRRVLQRQPPHLVAHTRSLLSALAGEFRLANGRPARRARRAVKAMRQ